MQSHSNNNNNSSNTIIYLLCTRCFFYVACVEEFKAGSFDLTL